ncbi:wax ester/triacylglycerol synthase family O-acyltransferase [Solimonas sp. K1W22B-7]|uniref:WS/DGAT/MGAT family O-acyltransferase n=1 Tax=Solimonas sp. K1W22B-7 TaxID=2303331 RepID=UPI000E336108|nr:wax ester/triacylglycerol synthase family O-acyltransferase [Solimonas sp. K1W22B-7]AXQ29955.1 wax ester/triacylglycerol synthase family O-acyltransferase [Solimonas sp. K1W22B-7]
MQYLSPVDASFLRMESKRTPMHVGGMLTFKLPDNAPPDFLRDLLQHMRSTPFMPHPFDCRLARGRMSRLAPAWVKADIDIDYHIRHSALPYPGGERELGVLVARLHSHPLDLSRPLWECHIIEGLENRRFAIYFKAHHCAIDGVGGMKMVRSWLTEDPTDMNGPGRLSNAIQDQEPPPPRSWKTRLGRPFKVAGHQIRTLPELIKVLREMSAPGLEGGTRAALSTPRSLLNQPISQQRRLGTQLLDLKRVKAISSATGTTVNDVSLAICGSAIRRYLLENGALPEKSLLASVPVALPRPEGKGGNAVAGFVCPFGTDQTDPLKRLQRINRVTTVTKQQLLSLSPTALEQFTLMGLSPLLLGQMAGVLSKVPPFFNVTVSNVVASRVPLYLRGAQLEAMYPMSILFDGYALNITLVGYVDRVAVGFTGCRDALPSLQKLAVYTGEALKEMEEALAAAMPASAAPKKKARAKS